MILDELSVRTQPRGGTVYRGMRIRGRIDKLDERRLIILVHGFNVNSKSARQTYQEFLNRLQVQVWPSPLESYGAFWGFNWPGDHRSRAMSVMTFSVRIDEAKEAGRQLARLIIERLKSYQEVFFVAHSLGCRVALEALYAIAEREHSAGERLGAPVRGVFLMAGAVPYQFCQDDSIFRRRDPQRPRDWVVHSTHDWVLRFPFPGGEWAHGENSGEAIGQHGWPIGRWHRSVPTELGHRDYWKTWPLVLENIPSMLDKPVAHRLPERPNGSQSGELPSSDLARHSLDVREIGAPLESDWKVLLEPI